MNIRRSIFILFFSFVVMLGTHQAYAQPSCPSTSAGCSDKWAGGEKNLNGHFQKHQGENSSWSTPLDYTNSAVAAMNNGVSHTIQNGPNAGRVMYYYYNPTGGGNVFVVTNSDSKIISSFKPTSGKKYFDKKVEEDKSGKGPRAAPSPEYENDGDIWTIYTTYQCNPHGEN